MTFSKTFANTLSKDTGDSGDKDHQIYIKIFKCYIIRYGGGVGVGVGWGWE